MSDLWHVAAPPDSSDDEYQPETVSESNVLLLWEKKFCDVTFTFPNLPDKIQAHEFFLKTRSPVFAKTFRKRQSGNVPSNNEIEISECTPERFQQFLEFIYADKFEVDIAGALDLLQLSQKYKVHPLTKKCKELLKTEIPIQDSVKVFETACRYGRRELMDRAGRIMVKSLLELVRNDELWNASEETLVYLLESDDLAVQEVGLFQFILDWGKNQVGTSSADQFWRNKLKKNLILKIRYTNMSTDEFTKVVVPTGFLSAEESLSVYTYLCADEVTRKGLAIKFNTTRRSMETIIATVTKTADFYANQTGSLGLFPPFTKHYITFKVDRTGVAGKVLPDYLLKKPVIKSIKFSWPYVNAFNDEHHVLNLNVSIWECSGPADEGNSIRRFEKKVLNCKPLELDRVSVEPPVDLVDGGLYAISFESDSNFELVESFRNDPEAFGGLLIPHTNGDAKIDLGDVSVTLKDIHRKTDFYAQELPDRSEELATIRGIEIGLQ